MNADHVSRLNKHRFRLVRDMHPDDLVDYLLSAEVFNEHHVKEIKKPPDVKDKSRALLDTLKERKNADAFDAFVEGLNETGQHDLANLLRGNITTGPATVTSMATGGVAAGGVAPVTTDIDSVVRKLKNIQENQVNRVLTKSLTFICENLELHELAPYMVEQGNMRQATLQGIKAKETPYERNQAMYDYLIKKDKEVFLHFVDGLIKTEQINIARKLAENL